MRVLGIHQEADSSLCTLEGPIHARGHVLEEWHPYRGDPAPDVGRYGAVMALGGVVHPDQDAEHGWLAGERALLAELVSADVPTLAVCLGGQLLAQALGAKAHRQDAVEVGWVDVDLSPDGRADPLLGRFPARFAAFEWHQYGFSVPDGARSLARSQAAPQQAFRFAEHAWALQFHIEVDAAMVALWMSHGRQALAEIGASPEAILRDTARHEAQYVRLAAGLSDHFLALAEARAAPRRRSA